MKRNLLSGLVAVCLLVPFFGKTQAFTENFDDITTLTGSGWFMQNNSTPIGIIPNWFQGNTTVFNAQSGAANSYIAANFNFVAGSNTISGWLVTPNRTFKNGDVLTFYARAADDGWADRMQIRLSTNGASTNVGTGSAAVGDFTTLLLDINPTQANGVFVDAWTLYTITISGLPAPTSGRIAFRYYVTSGGPSGVSSDFIGIDNVVYTPYVCPAFTMTTGGALTGGTAGSAYSTTLTQTGALGTPNFAVTAGALPSGLTLATDGTISGTPTATGTFNFTVTVNDASGCSGTESYSITVDCPTNPITFGAAPSLCDNEGTYTLTEASPTGGTYSGTGVSGGEFDPSSGTQTITYDYTDAYGCSHTDNYTITVNVVPTVSAGSDVAICDGEQVTLNGSGADSYSWDNGVNDGVAFTPATTTTYTVTGTDANNCENTATVTVTVNTLPTVNAGTDVSICIGGSTTLTASGATTYTWDNGLGASASHNVSPTTTTTYTVTGTDANGCVNTDQVVVIVNALPTVSIAAISSICVNYAPVTLTQGSPAGGTYSGTGVSGGDFNPATAGVGTHTITYTVTENGCEGTAQTTVEVDACLGLELGNVETLSIFPNPATSELNVVFENTTSADATVVLTTTDGKVVYTSSAKAMSVFNEKINVTDFANGVYLIKIQSETTSLTQKVVLK